MAEIIPQILIVLFMLGFPLYIIGSYWRERAMIERLSRQYNIGEQP